MPATRDWPFIKLISAAEESSALLDRLIVNCKQFRNCVDKAIKPFDWLRTAKCSTANTPGCDDITVQTADDNAIWIIHGACTTGVALVQVSGLTPARNTGRHATDEIRRLQRVECYFSGTSVRVGMRGIPGASEQWTGRSIWNHGETKCATIYFFLRFCRKGRMIVFRNTRVCENV